MNFASLVNRFVLNEKPQSRAKFPKYKRVNTQDETASSTVGYETVSENYIFMVQHNKLELNLIC